MMMERFLTAWKGFRWGHMSEDGAIGLIMGVNVLFIISFYLESSWLHNGAILLWIAALFVLLKNNQRLGKSRFMTISYGVLMVLAMVFLMAPWLYRYFSGM